MLRFHSHVLDPTQMIALVLMRNMNVDVTDACLLYVQVRPSPVQCVCILL